METTFIVKWTSESLDWVVDVSGYDKKVMWEVLKGNEPFTLLSGIRSAIIYTEDKKKPFEVYSITVDGITEKEFVGLFKEDPIGAKSLIRDRGRALHLQKEVK
jgi:hypothetical protein